MKLTRKELKRLLEAFVVDEQGNTVHIDKWYANNTRPHPKVPLAELPTDPEYTDELMDKIDPLAFPDPKMARYVYDQYLKGDLESKRHAVELAAQFGALPYDPSQGEDQYSPADAAHTELDVKHHEDFIGIRDVATQEGRKKFIDFVAELDAKRELFKDPADPSFKRGDPMTHADEVAEKFLEKHPNEDWPTVDDYHAAGIRFYWGTDYINDYVYRKPIPSTALVPVNKPKPKPKPKPKKEKKPWWKFWENKRNTNMKLSRKELRQLIEVFIAGPEGRVRKLTGNPFSGEDTEHSLTDDFMQKSLDKINDPQLKSRLDTLYAGNLDDKGQAVDLAASLIPPPEEESDEEFDIDSAADDAHFDLDTALNPAFDDIKDVAYQENVDLGLLKSFLNYLHKKGELVPTEKNKPHLTVYDVNEMFAQRYPGVDTYATELDYFKVGIEAFGDELFIIGYDPEKFDV